MSKMRSNAMEYCAILPGGRAPYSRPVRFSSSALGAPITFLTLLADTKSGRRSLSHSKALQIFGELGDYLQADVQKAHLRAWERVEKEMDALAVVRSSLATG